MSNLSPTRPSLAVNFAGIKSPNPFWLASAPPTNTGEQVMRAFDAGWGGAVWKTIGAPVQNVSSRYSSIDWNGQRMMGLNNIELISDRPIEVNLREITEVKKTLPIANAVIASLMVESTREAWHTVVSSGRRCRSGWTGAELRLSTWYERARHGVSRGPGAGVCGHDYRVGQGACADARHRQADAEYRGHTRRCACCKTWWRRCALRHQYHQLDHRGRPRYVCAPTLRCRQERRMAATAVPP